MSIMVVVSKKHEELKIEHTVVLDTVGIRIEVALSDFIAALVSEVDGVPLIMTKAQLLQKLQEATVPVIEDMKQSTVHNPPTKK